MDAPEVDDSEVLLRSHDASRRRAPGPGRELPPSPQVVLSSRRRVRGA